jgi:LysM repeat protein
MRTLGTTAALSVALGACSNVFGPKGGTMEYPGSGAGPNAVAVYVVNEKDTVDSISQRYGVPSQTIIDRNRLKAPYTLKAGQYIELPGARFSFLTHLMPVDQGIFASCYATLHEPLSKDEVAALYDLELAPPPGADPKPAGDEPVDITVEDPEALYDLDCDVFSPNAVGGVLNEHTIARLRCRIVAGGANNQLATEADGRRLLERGILYAPDYVINSAAPYAVIGAGELRYSPERLDVSVQGVAEALRLIFRRARAEGAPTAEVADRIAEERIASAAHLRAMAPGTGAVPRA